VAEEIGPEQIRAFYARFPDARRRKVRERVEEICRRDLGAEPTPEVVDGVLAEMARRLLANAEAIVREALTEEELGRLTDGEYDRLDEGQGVEEELLVDAVMQRVLLEHPYVAAPKRPGPQP
jgi:hypothetical protein